MQTGAAKINGSQDVAIYYKPDMDKQLISGEAFSPTKPSAIEHSKNTQPNLL